MPIPDFQSIFLPLLRYLADGRDHAGSETFDAMAETFGLTAEERTRLLPSGNQGQFLNRVAWAKSHLKKATLIEAPQRGGYRITEAGRELLKSPLERLDLQYLDRFPGHREFRNAGPKSVAPAGGAGQISPENDAALRTEENAADAMTPDEHVAYGYELLREQLAAELLQKVKGCPPTFFEQVVVDLLVAMGYGGSRRDAGRAVGRGGDGGIDGIIKEDRLGLDVIYLQAKRWDAAVGRPEVQKFAGALQGQRARKGVFITTSSFTKDARNYAAAIDSRIILIGGEELAGLMIDHGVGVTPVAIYEVKRLDSDYFVQE